LDDSTWRRDIRRGKYEDLENSSETFFFQLTPIQDGKSMDRSGDYAPMDGSERVSR
jgi:hypothetical protein